MNRGVNISRYIYAVLSGIPIGLILLIFGFKGVTINEDKLFKETGIIKDIRIENIDLIIQIRKSKNIYNTAIPEHISIIEDNLEKGDEITIYKRRGRNSLNFIEKLEKNGKVLIEFDKAPLIPLVSLILGLIITIAGIVYLIQNFSDLFGADEEKMEDFIDPWKKYKK